MRRKKGECVLGFQDERTLAGWQLSTSPLPPLAWQEKAVASARLAKGVGEKNEKEQEGAKVVCRVRVDRTAQVLLRQLPLQAQQAVDPYAKAARLAAKRDQEVATHLGSAYVAAMRRAGRGGRRRWLVPEARRSLRAWLPVEAAVFLR